jgi:hypothetical protein
MQSRLGVNLFFIYFSLFFFIANPLKTKGETIGHAMSNPIELTILGKKTIKIECQKLE